jgi:hypothetical protein
MGWRSFGKSATVPRILPLPQWEEDPRKTPSNVEALFVPQTDAYTKTSAIIDKELKRESLTVNRSGINEGEDARTRPLSFSIQITKRYLIMSQMTVKSHLSLMKKEWMLLIVNLI